MLAMMGSIGAEIGAVVPGAGTVFGSLFSRVKSVGTSGVGFISEVSGAGGGSNGSFSVFLGSSKIEKSVGFGSSCEGIASALGSIWVGTLSRIEKSVAGEIGTWLGVVDSNSSTFSIGSGSVSLSRLSKWLEDLFEEGTCEILACALEFSLRVGFLGVMDSSNMVTPTDGEELSVGLSGSDSAIGAGVWVW